MTKQWVALVCGQSIRVNNALESEKQCSALPLETITLQRLVVAGQCHTRVCRQRLRLDGKVGLCVSLRLNLPTSASISALTSRTSIEGSTSCSKTLSGVIIVSLMAGSVEWQRRMAAGNRGNPGPYSDRPPPGDDTRYSRATLGKRRANSPSRAEQQCSQLRIIGDALVGFLSTGGIPVALAVSHPSASSRTDGKRCTERSTRS